MSSEDKAQSQQSHSHAPCSCGFFTRRHVAGWITFFLILGVWLAVDNAAKPMRRDVFQFDGLTVNPEILSPHRAKQTYPNTPLFLTVILAPLGAFVVYTLSASHSVHDLHTSILAYAQGLAATQALTALCKLFGELRPDFWQRCGSAVDPLTGDCVSSDTSEVQDGRQSFFSGHSSSSFFFTVFTALWLSGKLGLFNCNWLRPTQDYRFTDANGASASGSSSGAGTAAALSSPSEPDWHDGWGHTLSERRQVSVPLGLLCVWGPLVYWSAYIANSRVVDNVHHVRDVIVGSIVGTVLAFVFYHAHYHCTLPYVGDESDSVICALPRDHELVRLRLRNRARRAAALLTATDKLDGLQLHIATSNGGSNRGSVELLPASRVAPAAAVSVSASSAAAGLTPLVPPSPRQVVVHVPDAAANSKMA